MAIRGQPATSTCGSGARPRTPSAPGRAIRRFGAPTLNLVKSDLEAPDVVFQIGVVTRRIDILTSIAGAEFDDAWPDRIEVEVDGLTIPVIGRSHLLAYKRATGRPKDRADALWLESHE